MAIFMIWTLCWLQERPAVVMREWRIELRDELGRPLSGMKVRVGLPEGEPVLITDASGRISLRTPARMLYLGLAIGEQPRGWYWLPDPPTLVNLEDRSAQSRQIQVKRALIPGAQP